MHGVIKKLVGVIIFCAYTLCCAAQDVRFSQYSYTPQVINAGSIASDNYMAAYVDYRSQNMSQDLTFNTFSLFVKRPFFNKDGRRIAAVGVGFLDDTGKGLTDINTYGFSGVFAYNFYLSDKWRLSSGLGVSYTRSEITSGNFSTGSQWIENRGYVPDVDNGESFGNLNTSYLSYNGGVQFYQEDEDGDKKHYFGVSVFHFNQPEISFLGDDLNKNIRYSAQAGVRVYKNSKYAISPEVILEETAGNGYVGIGSNFTYFIDDSNPYDPFREGSINLNVRNIVNEAVILAIQFNQPNFSVGFSYDIGFGQGIEPSYNATEFAFSVKKRLFGPDKEAKKVVKNYSVAQIKKFYKEDNEVKSNSSEQSQGEEDEPSEGSDNEDNPGEVQFELKREFSFGFNDTNLDREDELYLDDLVNLLKINKNLNILITGHADNVGSEGANKKISLKRAKVVEDYLIEKGVDKKRLKTEGKGDKEPLVPNDTEANRAKNRRVEFTIYKH